MGQIRYKDIGKEIEGFQRVLWLGYFQIILIFQKRLFLNRKIFKFENEYLVVFFFYYRIKVINEKFFNFVMNILYLLVIYNYLKLFVNVTIKMKKIRF